MRYPYAHFSRGGLSAIMTIAAPGMLQRPIVLLSPEAQIGSSFGGIRHDMFRHERLLNAMQRLRGRIYLEDGAIRPSELQSDGRHVQATDSRSWHLLLLDPDDESKVLGCSRFLKHHARVSFADLRVRGAALSKCRKWGAQFRKAVEQEIERAKQNEVSYLEIGGWALDQQIRGTTEALRSTLATFAWSRLIGGALGIATVTERNGSANILRRLGGQPLQHEDVEIPPYFDPAYNCTMEVLRFDSRVTNPRYENSIQVLENQLAQVPVITAGKDAQTLNESHAWNFDSLLAAA